MAKHSTRKSTTNGKNITTSRRMARVRKHASPGLDIDRLTTELHREQAARAVKRAAN